MLAHMPRFRMEHHEEMDRIYTLLAEPGRSGVVKQLVGGKSMDQPHLLRGDPIASRGDDAASLPTTLAWLEVLARLGFLQRNASWSAELDRLLVARDMAGIWRGRASKLGTPSEAWAWPTFPLSDPAEKDAWTARLPGDAAVGVVKILAQIVADIPLERLHHVIPPGAHRRPMHIIESVEPIGQCLARMAEDKLQLWEAVENAGGDQA